jgi:hypothetical protein
LRLFHVSEEPGITEFHPRPSPQVYKGIKGNVVFAISHEMLHNYLLPRDCPRVTYYAGTDSDTKDIKHFFGNSVVKFIVTIEDGWLERVNNTILYIYEMPDDYFELLDATAGYYISYRRAEPLNVSVIKDIPAELKKLNVELRTLLSLKILAEQVSKSSLKYSIIRMRNAQD